MSSEHLKCSLLLPTGHIVGKMHMSSKCTQHVITGFQAPLPPVSSAIFVNSAAPRTRPTRVHGPSLATYCHPSDGFSRILPKPALHHETTYPAVPALLAIPIHPAHSTASVTCLVCVRGSSVTTYGN